MKFKIGDIITNGEVTFRIEKIGQNHFGYYYKLVNVDTEKKDFVILKNLTEAILVKLAGFVNKLMNCFI